jgi:putative intracellular protease/amidase
MKKIVINVCHGGFGLSETAELLYTELAGRSVSQYYWEIERDDPYLVEVVERLGKSASGTYARLKVVEIPDDVVWTIHDYDGLEWVAEAHRTWS